MLPSRRELNFYKIAVFDLDAKAHGKSSEKYIDFEVKIQENYGKNRFPKRGIFLLDFPVNLDGQDSSKLTSRGRFWQDFGELGRDHGRIFNTIFQLYTFHLQAPGRHLAPF